MTATTALKMPTAPRMFAMFGFAGMAFFATEFYKPLLPEGTQTGMFTPTNMAIAAVVGWMVMGRLVGRGYMTAASSGVRTMAVWLFYTLLTWSFLEMIERSMSLHYEGPVEALQEMIALSSEYVLLGLTDPQVPIAVFAGSILAAMLAEWSSRQWN